MSTVWRLVAPLVILLVHFVASDDGNYMYQSGVFASIANIEDLLFPESMMMRKFEQYHDRLEGNLQKVKRYLQAWKELDLEPTIEDSSSSKTYYYETQKTALRVKETDLTRQILKLNSGKADNERLRGDDALINQGEITYPDENNNLVTKENQEKAHELREQLNDAKKQYESLTSEFLGNDTTESSLTVRKTTQAAPSGGGVQHPIDAYLLMKRLTVNWADLRDSLEALQSDTLGVLKEVEEDREKFMFPNNADLRGAAVALVRLQDVYGLDMASMGTGIIPGRVAYDNKDVKSIGSLKAWDYVLLGKQAVGLNYHQRAIQWFKMAVKASEDEELNENDLEVISKLRETIERNEGSSIEDNSKGKNKKKKKKKKSKKSKNDVLKKRASKLHQRLTPEEDATHQKLLCRGEKFLSPEYESSLSCRLERLQSPYLQLMPLKMEELHHSPRIVQFHQFLSEAQTNYMVKRARPQLDHSTHGSINGQDVSMIRVSMTGWLTEDVNRDDPLSNISLRIQAATSMDVCRPGDSEEYQVANYGIGGLYNAHPDFGTWSTSSMGDRLGTFLIYLSDVGAGGATVFTRLGVRATPKRGTALFWYNLFTDGTGDHLTIHAACPVLHGSKWITTKWIHYNSQFLKRSCSMRPGERYQYP